MNEDKASRYHRLRRRTSVLGAAATTAALLLFFVSGGSAVWRTFAARAAGGSSLWLVACYVVPPFLAGELLHLPFAFHAGVVLERRYGLSTESTAHWWIDRLRETFVGLALVLPAAGLVSTLLRWSPGNWWIWAGASFFVLLVLLAYLAPVVLLPLFYECTPLQREALVARLDRLAQRSGATLQGVFEWRLGDRTRKANAVLAGIGATRRILVSDTLLGEYSDDEIEVILAHELGHHVHHDIWTALVLEGVLLVAGLWVTDRVLAAMVGVAGVTDKADIAALPVALLSTGVVSLLLMPLVHACSRAHERRADRFALDATRNPAAFISAMRRLGAQHLAEDRPSRLVEMLFHSHPPLSSRISAAEAWAVPDRV